ncbi:MAG: peptidylprolyl isomerase [Acidobacteria bacterium]|nr:MAG: peptidylprolyl isomerase [Acidobacteriota bacterium]
MLRLAALASLTLLLQPALRNPRDEAFAEKAPERFHVRLETTRGVIVVDVHRAWSPMGVDRFFHLVENGYYDDDAFFRVIEGAWAQFGIHGDPDIAQVWRAAVFADEPVQASNLRGRVTYAHGVAPDDRTTQLFINLRDNPALDEQGFSPIGEVVEGMRVADALYFGYGEAAGGGIRGGKQAPIFEGGNAHLRANFPKLDYIRKASVAP